MHVRDAERAHDASRLGRATSSRRKFRAGTLQLAGARHAERALERTDPRLAIRREHSITALADGSHLESHQLPAP